MNDGGDNSPDREELVDRLKSVIGSKFEELSPSEVTEALGQLASDYSENEAVSLPEKFAPADGDEPESKDAAFLDAFSSTIAPFDLDRGGAVPLITISARSPDELSRICGQVLNVQALWLEMEDPPGLNREVEVLFDIPEHGFELALPGRIVHRVDNRTAVDVSRLRDDDLESLREIADRHGERREESDGEVAGLGEESSRTSGDVTKSWDGTGDSSLALSRTFETVTERESYWYGPKSRWLEPAEIGAEGEVRREADPEKLLLALSEQRVTGLLEFATDERQYQLHLDEGRVVRIVGRPHNTREELGPMLRVADRVSEDDLAKASSHAIKQDRSLELALHKLDILPVEDIQQAVAGRLTYLLRNMCDLGRGTAQITPAAELETFEVPAAEVRATAAVERVIFRRRLERYHQMAADERDGLIERDAELFPHVDQGAEDRLLRAFADDAHREFVDRLVDGHRQLTDLVVDSFLPPSETFSVLYALRSMSLLGFESDVDESVLVPRFSDDIEVKHLSVHKASYFEVLNVHWSSYGEFVESAYEFHRTYFDPNRAPRGLDPTNRKRLEEIAERIDSAYRVLRDRESRHGYRQKIMPTYKLEHAIPLLMERGRLAERRGRGDLARDAFRRVLEIAPDHEGAARRLQGLAETSAASA